MSRTFIINSDKTSAYNYCGINIEYVDLVELDNYEFNILSEWIDLKKKRKISVSEIRIALTHYSVWKRILDDKIKTAVILENSGIPTENFNQITNEINSLIFDYDLLYLGRKSMKSKNEVRINNLFVKPSYSQESYGYILTFNGATKLLVPHFLDNLLPIDEYLSIMHDIDYPYQFYSVFFNNFDKLYALALKTNIINRISKKNKQYTYLDLTSKNIVIYDEKKHKKIQPELVNNWILHSSVIFEFDTKNQTKFLLRKSNKYDIVEKFVYEIMQFHIKRLNKYYEDDIDVTFSIKIDDSKLMIENDKPFLTTITYLNCENSDLPTIITNINEEDYKFKDFSKEKSFCFSFPRKNKHISFEGGKFYHRHYNLRTENSCVLLINLYNKKIENVPYYNPTCEIAEDDFTILFEKQHHTRIVLDETMITSKNLESVCYEDDTKKIDELISKVCTKNDCYLLETEEKPYFNIQNFHFANNMFLRNFHFKKHLSKEVCMWLITESESYANVMKWTNIYNTSTPNKCLSFLQTPILYNFLKLSFDENIIPLIQKSFELNNNININIIDLFVVKYEDNEPDCQELCKCRCNITISILLSNILNKLNNNDAITCLEQGDLLITETTCSIRDYDSDEETNNNKQCIDFNKRYVLYFFVNLT